MHKRLIGFAWSDSYNLRKQKIYQARKRRGVAFEDLGAYLGEDSLRLLRAEACLIKWTKEVFDQNLVGFSGKYNFALNDQIEQLSVWVEFWREGMVEKEEDYEEILKDKVPREFRTITQALEQLMLEAVSDTDIPKWINSNRTNEPSLIRASPRVIEQYSDQIPEISESKKVLSSISQCRKRLAPGYRSDDLAIEVLENHETRIESMIKKIMSTVGLKRQREIDRLTSELSDARLTIRQINNSMDRYPDDNRPT